MMFSRTVSIRCALGAIAAATMLSPALAAPGELDSSFGSGGIATITLSSSTTVAKIAEQSNGALVVAAGATTVLRLLSNGSPDSSFGDQGVVSFSDAGNTVSIHDLQIQPNGKVLVLGSVTQPITARESRTHGVVARFNSDGSVDTTFGSGGQVALTPLSDTSDVDEPAALLLQTNGDILIADESGSGAPMVLRLTSDGSPDTSFGTGGVAQVSNATGIDALAVQSDGEIIAAGIDAERLLEDGAVDTDTAPGTIVASTGVAQIFQANSEYIDLQADGSPSDTFQIERFTFANKADSSFGDPLLSFGPLPTQGGIFSQANAIALQSNGDVVAVGRMEVSSGKRSFNTSFGVARVLDNGAVDTEFGTDGSVVTSFPSNQADATAVTVQTDGKIVVGGTGGGNTLAVARYLAE
jgi:uncharacterized delta-60 repeat protein